MPLCQQTIYETGNFQNAFPSNKYMIFHVGRNRNWGGRNKKGDSHTIFSVMHILNSQLYRNRKEAATEPAHQETTAKAR